MALILAGCAGSSARGGTVAQLTSPEPDPVAPAPAGQATSEPAPLAATAPAALSVMTWNLLFEYQRLPEPVSVSAAPSDASCDGDRAPLACTGTDVSTCRLCDGTTLSYRYSAYVREELSYLIPRPELRWENRRALIVRFVLDTQPDVVGFQEVQGDAEFGPDMQGFLRSAFAADFDVFAPGDIEANVQPLGSSMWPGPQCSPDQCRECRTARRCNGYDIRADRRSSQNWILYRRARFRPVDGGAFEIPTDDDNGRAVLRRFVTWVRLAERTTGREFVVMNAHAHPKIESVRVTEAQIISDFATRIDVPLVLVGDFNARPDSAPTHLLGQRFVDTFAALRDPVDPDLAGVSTALRLGDAHDEVRPGHRIDYIWATRDWTVESSEVLTPRFDGVLVDVVHDGTYSCGPEQAVRCVVRDNVYASDHFPVLSRLTW
ncbi:MAG: endonuclease/exonuclease/phosphatase family protein [Polyangiales bacterium]